MTRSTFEDFQEPFVATLPFLFFLPLFPSVCLSVFLSRAFSFFK